MTKIIYAVKDVKTSFWNPFVDLNEPSAIRAFSNLVKYDKDFAAVNYADMELWKLGTYDDLTGEIVSGVEYVACGRDFVKVGDANA